MIYLISIFALFSGVQAFADDSIQMRCDQPATVFHVSTQGDKVSSLVGHPLGIEYTQMSSGTPIAGLGDLGLQAEVLKKLGDTQIFTWPKANCTLNADHILYCTGGDPLVINGVKIKPVLLRSINDHLVMATGVFDVFNMTVVFMVLDNPQVSGLIFTLGSNYLFSRDCR